MNSTHDSNSDNPSINSSSSSEELTSTLHLSVRSIATPESALSALLESASPSEFAAITSIINGEESRAMVVVHRGPSKGARFLINQGSTTIGRSVDSAIFLDDVTVSRSHAVINLENNSFFLKDPGSLNGTYLNNELLTREISQSALTCGDEIQVGKFHMLFICSKK